MAGLALERMPIDAVDIAARRQQFVPLAIVTLGNAGTATDGFDEMFNEAAQHAAENLGFAETLTPDLKDAAFVPGQIAEAAFGQAAKDYQDFTGAGTSVLQQATAPTVTAGGGSTVPMTTEVQRRIALQEPPFASGSITGRVAFLNPYGDTNSDVGSKV